MLPPPRPSGVRLAGAAERHDDASLAVAALAGDRAAARLIVERHSPIVRRCLRASYAPSEVDDGVQGVFARAFEFLPRLRDPRALRSFIIGIALRFGAMERRRRRLRWREHLSPSGELPETAEFDDPSESIEVADRARGILARLSPEATRALELRFVHEKELTEVAATMGVSLATAKRHLVRVTARVRAMAKGEPTLAEYFAGAGA
jgi:RNA polymerase sigma-70 factor (ECF subfamily)